MTKPTYIQGQIDEVGGRYGNEIFDRPLLNIKGRIEYALGNRGWSWARRTKELLDEKNNMFRVLRKGRKDGTLTGPEAQAD